MLRKNYSKTGRACRVTFDLKPDANAGDVSLCGEFNDWRPDEHRMIRRRDGRFSTTLALNPGKQYRFKYLVDGRRWENDQGADRYEQNDFGTEDSIVTV